MEQDYGDKVRVEFYDVAQPEVRQRHPDVLEAVAEHNLPYPLTAVNDVFRFAGGISYYALQKVIQELLDSGDGTSESAKE